MEKITLRGGKSVLASDSYAPSAELLSTFVGRERELRMLTAAWLSSGCLPRLSPLLVGEAGVGKNRLVYELSRQTRLPLFILQGHEDVTAEDLACAVRFCDDGARGMEYVLSPLVTAMHCGGICFIDEIGKIRPRALALLVSVLDERRYIDSTLLGERVHAHPGFRFVAATNTGEVNSLPEFVRSRLRPVIEVGFPPQQEINEIIARHIPSEQNIAALLDVFWGLWAGAKRPPTPRDAIHQLALASSLGDFDRIGPINESNGDQSPLERQNSAAISGSVKTEHLREAFKQLFAQGLE